jgi:hypothetical protein
MQLVLEAGVAGVVVVVLFVAGVVVAGRSAQRGRDPFRAVSPVVVAVLAVGQLGQGWGQRLVRSAVQQAPDAPVGHRLLWLNEGAGEAAANLVLSGSAALLLVGFSLWMVRRRHEG